MIVEKDTRSVVRHMCPFHFSVSTFTHSPTQGLVSISLLLDSVFESEEQKRDGLTSLKA